jgi:outer membrane PBP1 activator LpoA protein
MHTYLLIKTYDTMPFFKSANRYTSSYLLIALVLVGCATTQTNTTTSGGTADKAPSVDQQDPLINQQLAAIEAFIAKHQVEEAMVILNSLDFTKMTIEQQTRYILAQTDTALIIGEGQQALYWISGEYAYLFDGLPLDKQIEIGLKRAEAYEYAGKPLSAARERIFLAPVLNDEQMAFNHEQIWFDLQLVNEAQLRELAEMESSPDLTGWIELSLISINQSDDLTRLLSGIESWQKRHRSHPASKKLPSSLQMLSELASSQPTHLGVLLPLSGPLERAGNAIRNGLLTSWYQAKDNGQFTPKLSFYDTSATEDIQNLYLQAITNGAETIIGPLSKTKVQRLSELEELPIPILALNYADAQVEKVENFYQFGFPPEDEAIQVADDIWKQGVRSVMVIAPDSTWGHRVSDAFIRHWQLIGGSIASKALFDKPDQYLGTIKKALNVRDSEVRHAILQRNLDIDLEFEFRRRQDVDVVFLAAFPAQARQLKPILNYQRASDIPVVAISSMYSGKQDANRDQDLEGIEFIDMPWRLSPSSTKARAIQAFPQSTNSYASLVAFGVDAYRLYPRLRQMSVFSDVRINGVTGGMTMNSLGRVERKLDWAVIKNGIAELKTETLNAQLP